MARITGMAHPDRLGDGRTATMNGGGADYDRQSKGKSCTAMTLWDIAAASGRLGWRRPAFRILRGRACAHQFRMADYKSDRGHRRVVAKPTTDRPGRLSL